MTNEKSKWVLPVEEDPETKDLMITFPPELLAQAGWDSGDVITWQDNNDGSYTLTKKEQT
jgi:hypothetical protein